MRMAAVSVHRTQSRRGLYSKCDCPRSTDRHGCMRRARRPIGRTPCGQSGANTWRRCSTWAGPPRVVLMLEVVQLDPVIGRVRAGQADVSGSYATVTQPTSRRFGRQDLAAFSRWPWAVSWYLSWPGYATGPHTTWRPEHSGCGWPNGTDSWQALLARTLVLVEPRQVGPKSPVAQPDRAGRISAP